MKPLQIAVLLAVSWVGSLGIAYGVQEWRGDSVQEDPSAALIAQAEACRSAVSWWNAIKDRGADDTELARQTLKTSFNVCGKLDPSWKNPFEEDD